MRAHHDISLAQGQGDSLSPCIFVMVMKIFSINMDLATTARKIKFMRRGDDNCISHLLFVDDLLILTKGSMDYLH